MAEKEIKRLYRSLSDRVLFGVCGGLGEYFHFDANLIRIVFVLLTLFSGFTFALAYLVMAILIPEEPFSSDL